MQTVADVPEAPRDDRPLMPLIHDPDLARHVAALFLSTAPDQMDRLREAIAGGAAVVCIAGIYNWIQGQSQVNATLRGEGRLGLAPSPTGTVGGGLRWTF